MQRYGTARASRAKCSKASRRAHPLAAALLPPRRPELCAEVHVMTASAPVTHHTALQPCVRASYRPLGRA